MLRPVFAFDATVAETVHKMALPSDIVLREVNFSGSGFAAGMDAFDVLQSGATEQGTGSMMLGVVLPAQPGTAKDSRIEQIRNLLPEYLRGDGIFFVSKRTEAALGDWCWRRLCLTTEHLMREYARSHLALAGYREREQQLERALGLAEAAFADFRKEPLKLALRTPPSGVYVRHAASDSAQGRILVRQVVPVLMSNVLYVDLFFSRDGAGLSGEGRLKITSTYAETILCDSRFLFDEIRQGWKRFACAAEDIALRQPLTIELDLSAEGALDMLPGLGAPSPIPEDCAAVAGGGSAGRPLAMQIWCGIAGIRYPRHVNALAPIAQAEAADTETFSVPSDVLVAATPFFLSRRNLDFAPVSYDAETQSLLVHPLGRVPTAAKLSGLRVTNLKSVSALVQLRRFDAQPTDCAILVFRADDRPPRFDDARDQDERVADALSWLHLQGGEWGEARIDLPDVITGEIDIYLVTRNQSDDYNFSWAFFRGLQLLCQA